MKKFSLFILCFLIPNITNPTLKAADNTDVGQNLINDNAKTTEVQPVLNSEVNYKLPNTDEKTAFMPNINSRHENGWGEQKNESFTAKKFILFKNDKLKRPEGDGNFYNCTVPTDNGPKYCLPEKGQLNSEIGVILRKDKATLDSNGFITDLQKPVLYGQGPNIQIAPNVNLKDYFYRFWNENAKDCKSTGHTSCWSPAYPIICNSNFNHTNFEKLKDDKDGALKARHYFGWRERLDKDDNKYINAYTTDNDYKVHVYMAPIEKDSEGDLSENTNKETYTALSPTGWKINEAGNCLDPEFDYDLTSSDSNGNATTETLVTDDTTSSLSKPKKIENNSQILPCGSFSNNSQYKGLDFKGIAKQTCSDEYYSIRSNLNYNYDKYAVHMPLSEKFTNDASLNNRDNYDTKDIYNTKQMKTRICGTCNENINNFCEEIVRGVLHEKCSKNGNKFNCETQQLDSVVSRLKINGDNFTGMIDGNKISGYTNKKMECKICLYKLNVILSGGPDPDNTNHVFSGLLN